MRRSAAVLALAGLTLALAGCSAKAPGTAAVTRPVAAIVAEQSGAGAWPASRVLRVRLDGSGVETLPMTVTLDSPPRLSPDRRYLLYAQPETRAATPHLLDRYDLCTGETTTLLDAPLGSFGWTAEGEPVAITATPAEGWSGLSNASFCALRNGRWQERSLEASVTREVRSFTFLAGRQDSMYLVALAAGTPNSTEYSVWRYDLASGTLTDLADLQPRMLGSPFQAPSLAWGQPLLPSSALLDAGLPIEHNLGANEYKTGSVDVRRLSDMKTLRSFEVTPAFRSPVYDGTLTRYLVSADAGRLGYLDLELGDSRTGTSERIVRGTKETPKPLPVGFAGEDVLYRSLDGSRIVLELWERSTGTSRKLADLGAWDGAFHTWWPATTLIGVEYR